MTTQTWIANTTAKTEAAAGTVLLFRVAQSGSSKKLTLASSLVGFLQNANSLALAGQSLTAAQATPIADLAATWNTTGTPTAFKVNITDTASNAASLLIDLQVGGVSQFSVTKAGALSTKSLALAPPANTAAINASGFSVTGSSSTSGLSIFGTWNTTGTPSLILADVTDTASDAASLLMDLRVGTVPKFNVTKGGALFATSVNLTATQAADSVGTRGVPQNSQSAAYTLVAEDAGKHILHPSADTTARTFTIPANGTVAFAVGTVVTFINQDGAGVVTIAITTDTMRLAGAGTTGSRTLAANGIATAIKLTSTEWIISGTSLT
jgi:hypothetical protein